MTKAVSPSRIDSSIIPVTTLSASPSREEKGSLTSRKRVQEFGLQNSVEGTSSVRGVIASSTEVVERLGRDVERDILSIILQSFLQNTMSDNLTRKKEVDRYLNLSDTNVDDRTNFLARELGKNDNRVDPVDELGKKMRSDRFLHELLRRGGDGCFRKIVEERGAQIRRHDDH